MTHVIFSPGSKVKLIFFYLFIFLADDYEPAKIHRRHESDEIHSKHDSGMLFDYETDYHHSGEAVDHDDEDEAGGKFQHKRSRRSSQEYFVEIMVVADSTMARYHGAGVENYILALMYIVSFEY